MDLDHVWEKFMSRLTFSPLIESAEWKKVAGIPFLYIFLKNNLTQQEVEKEIIKYSALAMKGKRLQSQTIFVRRAGNLLVFRHRFYVPQKKMFCCGNLCVDCTRLK